LSRKLKSNCLLKISLSLADQTSIHLSIFLSGLFLLFCFANLSAQEEEIVKAKTFVSKSAVHPGETFKVALEAAINPGWHIHAHELADEFLIPTEILFEGSERIEIIKYSYPEPRLEKFEYSESPLQIYDGKVILGALVKADAGLELGSHKIKGSLSFQACDSRSCLPPKKIEFEISFKVVPASQKTEEVNQDIFSKLNFEKI
jgi:DsbC/DsbD-like thiol-disulfide interchange protein